MKNNNFVAKRAHMRFKPQELESLVLVDTSAEALKDNFSPDVIGIALSESRGGCSFVARRTPKLRMKDIVLIKVGELFPIYGEVVWRADVDLELIKIGIKYRE